MKFSGIIITYILFISFTIMSNTNLIQYSHNGKTKKIRKNSKVLFIQNNDSIFCKVCNGEIQLPSFDTINSIDVVFYLNGEKLFFNSINPIKLRSKQKMKWELSYFDKFNKKIKSKFYQIEDFSKIQELYYWKFEPLEFGDGTSIIVTIPSPH